MYRFISIISIFFFYLNIFAKGGDKHIQDMIDVYPFEAQKGSQIYLFFESVQAYIDYQVLDPKNQNKKVGNPIFLKENPRFANTTWDNHRIGYHWGFNTDIKYFKPLTKLVKKNFDNENDKNEFYACMYGEIRKRNIIIMELAAKVLGYSPNHEDWSKAMRDQINAFVAIPYAVHILGDHTTTITEVIQPIDGVVESIYTAIDKIAGKSNIEKAKQLKKKLYPFENNPIEFLNALKKFYPKFMLSLDNGIYDIKKKGIKLKS